MGKKIEVKNNIENDGNDEIKKLIIQVIVTVIVIIAFVVIMSRISSNKDIDENYNSQNTNTITTGPITTNIEQDEVDFECSLAESTNNNFKMRNGAYSAYGVGDYVYCNISLNKNISINAVEMIFYDMGYIELIDVYSISDDWDEPKISEMPKKISISTNNKNANIEDINFKFYIKDKIDITDYYKVIFKNIIFKNLDFKNNNNYKYKVTGNLVAKLPAEKEREYVNNGILKYEMLDSDGSFKTLVEYKCMNAEQCSVYIAREGFNYKPAENNKVMIYDRNNNDKEYYVLYDFENGIIGTYGINAKWLFKETEIDNTNGTYIYINDKDSNKYGIIDKNGKIIKEFNIDTPLEENNYKNPLSKSLYSIEDNMIADIKDNKYGIIKITENKIIIDYLYDDIGLINKKYFKAKENDKWYLYSFETKEKHIDESFDNIYLELDNLLIVEKDNIIYIRDYENSNLTEETIKITEELYACAYLNYEDNNIIEIYITNNEYCKGLTTATYEYNIKDKKLTIKD